MKLSIEAYMFAFAMVGMPMIIVLLIVNDRIIRHICRREGKRYSYLWLFGSYWHRRIVKLGWFAEARDAGYLPAYATLAAAWACYIAAALYLWPRSGVT